MIRLTDRQKEVLRTIYKLSQTSGYPPTVRELGEKIGVSSSCTVQRHLETLERKGYIKRSRSKARTIEIINSYDPTMLPQQTVPVALVGTAAAGQPITAVEHIEGVFALPQELVGSGESFMLRVQGESMIEAGLSDGDLVVVKRQETADNGDIVVALLDDEATIKRLYRRKGKVWLEPANPRMKPIICDQVSIIGKVILGIKQFA